MTWAKHTLPIQIGDEIAYSAAFLNNTGQHTGEAPFARGTVTNLVPLGATMLAENPGSSRSKADLEALSAMPVLKTIDKLTNSLYNS